MVYLLIVSQNLFGFNLFVAKNKSLTERSSIRLLVAGVGLRLAAAIRRLRAAPPLSSARGKQSTGLFASRSRLLKVQVPGI